MWMDQIEKFQKASGNLASWQHGGRSGVGVLSCYKQLIPRLKIENTIYEFDIKGFFDNISHEVIIARFEETMGPIIAKWISNILKAKPTKYILPSEDKDIAAKKFKAKLLEDFMDDWGTRSMTYEEAGFIGIHDYSDIPEGTPVSELSRYVLFSEIEAWDVAIAKVSKPKTLEDEYKNLMSSKEPFTRRVGNSITGEIPIVKPTEQSRAQGRDNWKDLGQPGRGVPQGLGTSPFISTFMTDTYLKDLKNNLIMYMDDGILFAKSPQEMTKLRKILDEKLNVMGLEIAPEKSKYSKKSNKWLDTIKFLGLRYLPESDTFMSDTRSGTKVQFPAKGDWEDVKNMAAINHTNVSNIKQKFDKLINTQAYEAGLKYGFLGCMIAGSQYKDNLPMEARKDEIRKGQNSAWAAIEKSKGFIWKSQDLCYHTEYLTNVSSIACHRFAEFNRIGRKLFIRKGKLSTRRRI
jgi:hypothetical protein